MKQLAAIVRLTAATFLKDDVIPVILPDPLQRVGPEPKVFQIGTADRDLVYKQWMILARAESRRHSRHLVEVRQAVAEKKHSDERRIARSAFLRVCLV